MRVLQPEYCCFVTPKPQGSCSASIKSMSDSTKHLQIGQKNLNV